MKSISPLEKKINKIGSKIKDLRIAKGMSEQALAQKLGVNQNTLSRYENSVIYPSLEVLVLLADYS